MTMRSILTAAIFSILALTSCKKDNTAAGANAAAITVVPQSAVPAAIVSSFTASFAGATEVEWHSRSNHFEVEFNHQSQHHLCGFDDDGKQNSHNISCISGAVPAVVLAAFRARYPNDAVTEWSMKNDGSWQAHFVRNGVTWEALFNANGVFIKEEHS